VAGVVLAPAPAIPVYGVLRTHTHIHTGDRLAMRAPYPVRRAVCCLLSAVCRLPSAVRRWS